MSAIWLKFQNAKSLANALKRIYFTVLKCLLKNLIDHQISEILTTKMFVTTHNFQNVQLLACKCLQASNSLSFNGFIKRFHLTVLKFLLES